MNKREEALVITMEECGELIQACSKVIRTKEDTKYIRNLQDEIGDVMCMIQLLIEKDLVNQAELNKRIVEKREKLKTFSTLTNL